MARQKIIAGNWKMHKTSQEAESYFQTFLPLLKTDLKPWEPKVLFAVPFTALRASSLAASKRVIIGAQNIHDAERGAFTGETSAHMVKAEGAHFVLLGHSERRKLFGETDAWIARKVQRALSEKLEIILCVGETQEERDAGHTKSVLEAQLNGSLAGVNEQDMQVITIAYEPVWAIGTGKVATAEMAQESHMICRTYLQKVFGAQISQAISIIYGGSVKSEHMPVLMQQPDIDGVLVGGASLDPLEFAKIANLNSEIGS